MSRNVEPMEVKITWSDLTEECQNRIEDEWCSSGHAADELDYFGEEEIIATFEVFNI